MANFKKTGDLYVDPSNPNASDSNAGTDPDLPKLTIKGSIASASNDDIIIIADCLIQENELEFPSINEGKNNLTIEGDGLVIIEGDNVNDFIITNQPYLTLRNLVLINHRYTFNVVGGTGRGPLTLFDNCTIINSPLIGKPGAGTAGTYSINSRWINSEFNMHTRVQTLNQAFGLPPQINRSIFINSPLTVNYKIINSVCESPINLTDFDLVGSTGTFNIDDSDYNNINSTIEYENIIYASLSSFRFSKPLLMLNSINESSLFNRLPNEQITLDFSVEGNSPLLGSAESGANIGSVKRGIPSTRNSDSIQNGIISNIVFDGNRFQIQGGNTTGTITSAVIDFGLTVKSPIINIKGIVNFLDNVPDFNNILRDPNKLDIECRWAIIGEDITLKAWKPFLFNEIMLLDSTGKSNAEENFDWGNTVIIPMKEVQYRLTLRQNYNN